MEGNYGFWKGFLGRNEDEREEVLAASSLGGLEMEKSRSCVSKLFKGVSVLRACLLLLFLCLTLSILDRKRR